MEARIVAQAQLQPDGVRTCGAQDQQEMDTVLDAAVAEMSPVCVQCHVQKQRCDDGSFPCPVSESIPPLLVMLLLILLGGGVLGWSERLIMMPAT